MKRIFYFLFFLLFNTLSFCQSDDTFFINLMKTEFEAFQKKDPADWINNIDDNAVFTGADNTLKTKDQIVEEMRNAPSIFSNASETYENVVIKTYSNTAVLSCLTTFSFTSNEGSLVEMKFKFSRVHIKEGNNWKLVYHSAIPVEI